MHVTPALSLRQCLHGRVMTWRACASEHSHLQGPPLPRPSCDSQNVRWGGGRSARRHVRPLPGSALLPPPWTHLPFVSLSQSSSWGTLLSRRTRPCPGPTISPGQPLKSPSSSMTRTTSSRLPPSSTAGTSEMGMSLLAPLDAQYLGPWWWPHCPRQGASSCPTFACSQSCSTHSSSICPVPNSGCTVTRWGASHRTCLRGA